MTSSSKCLITGCTLQDQEGGPHVHGDLHEIGDCYVFNAILTGRYNDEAAWQYNELPAAVRCLIIQPGGQFFERRGVIVIPKAAAELNTTAKEFIHV